MHEAEQAATEAGFGAGAGGRDGVGVERARRGGGGDGGLLFSAAGGLGGVQRGGDGGGETRLETRGECLCVESGFVTNLVTKIFKFLGG